MNMIYIHYLIKIIHPSADMYHLIFCIHILKQWLHLYPCTKLTYRSGPVQPTILGNREFNQCNGSYG